MLYFMYTAKVATTCPPFPFQVLPMEERQKMYTKRAQERAQREKDKTDLARQLAEDVERRRNQKAFSASVPVAPRTTHSFLIKTAQTQAKLAKERCEIQRETDREKKMRARQDETKNHLAEVMRRIDREQGRQFRRDTHQEAEHKSRESHEKYRRALKENKARLEQVIYWFSQQLPGYRRNRLWHCRVCLILPSINIPKACFHALVSMVTLSTFYRLLVYSRIYV